MCTQLLRNVYLGQQISRLACRAGMHAALRARLPGTLPPLRLRWPYVRGVLLSAAEDAGLSEEQRRILLERAEAGYTAPFPPASDETLAGGLSNTIAG